jgi:NDP-sugar pyrophosphorylase family protein
MRAMILAAGFGTRLFPLTVDRTKPAIPFLGKPLVGYVAEYLARYGFTDIVVNLHHEPDSVRRALGSGTEFGVRISYSVEQPSILGTAGALAHARPMLGDEAFLAINGKIITDIDLGEAIESHRSSGAIATMVLLPNTGFERFTVVETEGTRITGFGPMADEVPGDERDAERPPLMFTGIQILEPRVFDYVPAEGYADIVPTFYNPAIAAGEHINAHITTGRWYELSTIPRYLDISLNMLNGRDVSLGTGCRIDAASSVHNSVIWDNVTVNAGALLERTIIADGVEIPEGRKYTNAAIVRAEMIRRAGPPPAKASKGYFDDQNYIVPLT